MLVLNRKVGERIVIGENIEVVVLEVHPNRVKLGFKGPPEVPIHRQELYRRIAACRTDGRSVPRPVAMDGPAVPPLVAAD